MVVTLALKPLLLNSRRSSSGVAVVRSACTAYATNRATPTARPMITSVLPKPSPPAWDRA